MCGIVGVIANDLERAQQATEAANKALAHRGPDGFGVNVEPFGTAWLGLGHRRLSILDLSAAGHQPMRHSSGSWITFNGEIYNCGILRGELEARGERFRGHSDTEVLLAALSLDGPAALSRLEGMYAFIFYDAPNQRVILARDPIGIKPLYFARVGESLVAASEVRAILASGLVSPKLSLPAIAGYLAYGAVQHPATLFQGIESLPPGSWLEIRLRTTDGFAVGTPKIFWDFPRPTRQGAKEATTDHLRERLDLAVKDHLMADVPVGVFLSSGLDSTAVAGFASRHCPNLSSFTVGFVDTADFSEFEAASATADRLGLVHHEIRLSAADGELAAGAWLKAMDQPSIDGLNTFIISREVRARGIKVALSGLGGDELFGGYPSFKEIPRLLRTLRWGGQLPRVVRRGLAQLVSVGRSDVFRAKLGDMVGGRGDLLSLYLQRRRVMSDQQLHSLGVRAGSLNLTDGYLPAESLSQVRVDDNDPVWSVSVLESRFYQGNMLLRDTDADGMAHGLEIRVPLLDQRLLDLVHAIPGPTRMPPGAPGKFLLRNAASPFFTPELLAKPKRGFTLPIGRWMTTSLQQVCEESLDYLTKLGLLQAPGVEEVWKKFLQKPSSQLWTRAFSLCVLGAYVRSVKATA